MTDSKPDKSLWLRKIEAEPEHSRWFIQRFRDMIAAGKDIAGEARFVDAMVPRGALILDAGCGSGRTGGPLAALGHTVIGVDVDPALVAAAQEDYPAASWQVGDLAELNPGALGAPGGFDAVVAAGNVMPFLAPSTRREVLHRLRAALKPGGRAALGFGAGRGYPFDEFFADAAATGWQVHATFRGWNLLPFDAESDFLVVVMAPGAPGRGTAGRTAGGRAASGPADADTPEWAALGSRSQSVDPMAGHTLRPMT